MITHKPKEYKMSKKLGISLVVSGIVCFLCGIIVLNKDNDDSISKSQPTALSQNIEAASTQVIADTVPAKKPEMSNAEKGKLFEDYIIRKFDFSRKALELVSRDDSHGAKQNADFLIKLTTKKGKYNFAVECAWRKEMPEGEFDWTKEETLAKMIASAKAQSATLFLVLGCGGKPDSPGNIYIVPLTKSKQATLSSLTSYKCDNMYGKFFYDGPSKKLMIK